jgi:hypothetical protein
MGCSSSREKANASSNNVFEKELNSYILKEQPNSEMPKSEVARLTLCKELHTHFRQNKIMSKLWRAYSSYGVCPTPDWEQTTHMTFLQLQTLVIDLFICDKDKDRILHERHMTGDKRGLTANPITTHQSDHQIALSVGLRKTQDVFEGYLNYRNEKIKEILKKDKQLINLCKKAFKQMQGRLERSAIDNDGNTKIKPERPVTYSEFLDKFRVENMIDLLNIQHKM